YPGFQPSGMPALAVEKVRHPGEAVAMVVAEDEYVAEDGASLVFVDYEELTPVLDVEFAISPEAPLIHEGWKANYFVERSFTSSGYEEAARNAPHTLTHRWYMARHSGVPLEGRAVIADYDS